MVAKYENCSNSYSIYREEYLVEGKLSDEEFMEKLYDINYLKKVFNLSDYHLSDEDYKELFDSIIKEKKVL